MTVDGPLTTAVRGPSLIGERIQSSSHLRFERLGIRYGGDFTTLVTGATGVVFDHVSFMASSHGVRTGTNKSVTFQHCEFDGGKPSWYFRNDGKRNTRLRQKERTCV